MNNNQLLTNIETKLFQIKSMAKIALDNHNYKNAGYDEPFINNIDMGNLIWAIVDIADEASNKLDKLELKEEPSHV